MADTAYSFSNVQANLLKEVYDPAPLRYLLKRSNPMWDMMQDWDGDIPEPGKYTTFGVLKKLPSSFGGMDFSGTVPEADIADEAQGRVTVYQMAGQVQIEHAFMKHSNSNRKAFENGMDLARRTFVLTAKARREAYLLGGHLGVRALTNGAEAAGQTVISVHGSHGYTLGNGTAYIDNGTAPFEVGQKIVFDVLNTHAGSGGGAGAGTHRTYIDDVDPVNQTITIHDALPANGFATDCPIHWGDANCNDRNTLPHGLLDILAKTSSYLNIDPATVGAWNPRVYTGTAAGTPETLVPKHLTRLLLGNKQYCPDPVDTIIASNEMVSEVYDIFDSQIEYDPVDFQGGMASATWQIPGRKVKLLFDNTFPHNCLIAFPKSAWSKVVMDEGGWMDQDGSWLSRISGKTQYGAIWVELWEAATKMRPDFLIQKDIIESLSL